MTSYSQHFLVGGVLQTLDPLFTFPQFLYFCVQLIYAFPDLDYSVVAGECDVFVQTVHCYCSGLLIQRVFR